MNTADQDKLQTLGNEIADDIELGKRVVAAYRQGGKGAVLALLPEVIREAQEDFSAVTAAAPIIKAGWRTTEFWLVAIFIVANLALSAWKGVSVPTEVNVAVGAVIAAYVAVRGIVKARAAAPVASAQIIGATPLLSARLESTTEKS
jgi:hypothetical protein